MFEVLLSLKNYKKKIKKINFKNHVLILYILIFFCSTSYFTGVTFAMDSGVDLNDLRIEAGNAVLGETRIDYRDSRIFCINDYRDALINRRTFLEKNNAFDGGKTFMEKFYYSGANIYTYFRKDINICYGYESDLLDAIKKFKK